MPDNDWQLGQNEVDVRNEARRAQHYAMPDWEVEEIAGLIAKEFGTRYEVSPREREDDERRDRHDESVDPWGYDDPELERDDD